MKPPPSGDPGLGDGRTEEAALKRWLPARFRPNESSSEVRVYLFSPLSRFLLLPLPLLTPPPPP